MKKPEAKDSDLIKLVREFEAKRQERERLQKELERISKDCEAIAKYFQDERAKLDAQRAAVYREQNVLQAELGNVEGLMREAMGLDNAKACCDVLDRRR